MKSLSKNLILLFVLFAFAQGVWAQTYITVSNETELRNAITDGANILFTQDIPITSVLEITGNKTVTLDLGGNTLDRGLTAQATNGQVITVRNGSTLNLSNGTLTGGYGGDGGGIRNEGTLTLTDCAVVNNIADNSNPLFPKSGSSVWNNATLNIQGNVQIKDNNDDDVYLPTGSKITVTDALTGGPGSIGVRMQIPGVFTSGYQSHNSETDHFFSNIVPNDIVLVNGEAKMHYGYYECSRDGDSRQLVHIVKHIPDNAQIVNVCDINNGGVLWGNDYWFIAEGTNSTVNGLTCNGSDIHLILCDDAQYTINEGLFVNEGTALHVYCQSYGDRMGKLICIGDDSQPGIGPKYDDNGIGYLYANNGNGESNYTVIFMGELQPSKEDVSITPYYDPNAGFKGWNLVGNPFACDAYLNDASDESMAFYRMNDDGDGFIAATGAIHQLEGIFVQATAPDQSFNFSRTQEESSRGGSLFLDLYRANTRNANVVDNAIVRFGSANTLEKFYFNDRNAKLYIPQDDKDYAVVHAYKTGELSLNFKVTEDGIYTLGFNLEGIDFDYLHLIDNLTGADVDLLAQTHEDIIADSDSQSLSYTFTAKSTDYESRFRLVFSVNNEE